MDFRILYLFTSFSFKTHSQPFVITIWLIALTHIPLITFQIPNGINIANGAREKEKKNKNKILTIPN